MKKIGVLYLGKRGGPNIDTLEMCKALVRDNHLYLILSKQIENLDDFRELQRQNSEHVTILLISTYKTKLGFLFKSINIFRFLLISQKTTKQKLSFIYIPMITYWGAIVSLFLRKQKLVTAIHDPDSHVGEANFILEKLTKVCVRKSSYLVVFSNKFIKPVSQKYFFDIDKIIPLKLGGYSYYKKNNESKAFYINNKVLFFGRISEYKGLGVLLEAIKQMRDKGSHIVLKVVGNGTLTDKENNLISVLGDGVELVNRWIKDEEVESFFKDIDFTVLPYIEASQSGVVMLSYAMQKSVLATNVGALDEQILDDTGIIVEPNNVEALIQGIKRMYENNCFYEKGIKGFHYATNEWTWEKQAQKLLDYITD